MIFNHCTNIANEAPKGLAKAQIIILPQGAKKVTDAFPCQGVRLTLNVYFDFLLPTLTKIYLGLFDALKSFIPLFCVLPYGLSLSNEIAQNIAVEVSSCASLLCSVSPS